ncbi:MAG: circadian clock protein KaiC [Thermoanaerobaculia bacterium]|jgi:KaiC/GvpD/RAD55 family RecA-like ATPase/DNA-binding response OmpR family regulator|nr:circadian clock protein KaiC [Thermoanaerobaculia bacterium]
MNGSMDVRSSNPSAGHDNNIPPILKTDTELPLGDPIVEPTPESAAPSKANAADCERCISGIDLLDYGAGGLMPHKVYLVKGAGGVGKTLFGLQFLTRGLEHQEPGILITDQKPENVLAQARGIGFAIDEAVKRGQLAILNPSNRYFELVESPADVMAIVGELGDLITKIGARRLVIDPVYTLINTSYSSHFATSITQSLINALEDLPVTTILVGEEDDPELNAITRQLEHNAFGVVSLTHDKATGGRLMRASNLRYASNDDLTSHYRILNGRGLINYRGEDEKTVDVTKAWETSRETSRKVLLLGASQETIRRVQESLGSEYEVQAESDLKAGVERVKRERPGLVLVTPSRSVTAIAAILDLAHSSASSIAFLSPNAHRQSERVLYLRAGADDFITEPFSSSELRARVDALIRRSGRRLNLRGSKLHSITPDEMSSLMSAADNPSDARKGPMLNARNGNVDFEPEFNERLQRNVDTVTKLDQPFALYWIKADEKDADLNRDLAKLCRQEDIVCHNRNGEFVAILTGTDQNGVKGFENRLNEKLGTRLRDTERGYKLHNA